MHLCFSQLHYHILVESLGQVCMYNYEGDSEMKYWNKQLAILDQLYGHDTQQQSGNRK